jgi:hypothetical protein
MDNAKAYLEWLTSFVNERTHEPSVMSDAHQEIAGILNGAMLSLDEIIVLFAGIASTYCKDATDVNVAGNLFDDTIYECVAIRDHGEAEIVDEVEDEEDFRW